MDFSLMSRPRCFGLVVLLLAVAAQLPALRVQADDSLYFQEISSSGEFASPQGLAVDTAGNVYVADSYSSCPNLKKYTIADKSWVVFMENDPTLGTCQLQGMSLQDVAVATNGTIYFTTNWSSGSHYKYFIYKINPDLTYSARGSSDVVDDSHWSFGIIIGASYLSINSVASNNFATYSGVTWAFDLNTLNYLGVDSSLDATCLASVTENGAGNLYVFDYGKDRVVVYEDNGDIAQTLGTDQQFNTPRAIAADGAGNIYVADTGNNRIQKYTASSQTWTVWGGTAPGSDLGQFNAPRGIAVTADGKVYVSDTGNARVVVGLPFPKITITGVPTAPTPKTSLTLTLSATDVSQYKYKLDDGAWSSTGIALAANPTISLTGLAPGRHTLSVISGTSDGQWQVQSDATTATWTVLPVSTVPLILLLQN